MAQPESITLDTPQFDQARAEAAVRELLLAVGEDPTRHGLQDTPARVARAFREMFAGLYTDPDSVLETTFDEQHDERRHPEPLFDLARGAAREPGPAQSAGKH